jgi:hypothetical protein
VTVWVESMGGPLVVVPESAVANWGGGTSAGTIDDDYDRACAVNASAAVIPMRGAQALVLGDEPATTCFRPDHRAFVRWLAADSEDDVLAAATHALNDPATPWEDVGTWTCDGPAVLMDSAIAGLERGPGFPGGSTTVPLDPGTWTVRVANRWVGRSTEVGLVRLVTP